MAAHAMICSLLHSAGILFVLGTFVHSSEAQDGVPQFTSHVTEVWVDFTVMNGGKPLKRLRSSDFVALDNERPQQITYLSEGHTPQDIVLLLDVSGSMFSWLDHVARVSRDALAGLDPSDRVAVIAFATRPHLESLLTDNRQSIEAAIGKAMGDATPDFRDTQLFRAIYYSVQFLKKTTRTVTPDSPHRQRSILVITDNNSSRSKITREQIAQLLSEGDIAVYALLTPSPLNPMFFSVARRGLNDDVVDLTSATGGQVQLFYYPDLLKKMLTAIGDRYNLAYSISNPSKGEHHTIRIILSKDAEKRFKKAKILAREGYNTQ